MNKRGTIEKKANKSKLYRHLMATKIWDNPKDIISLVSALPRKNVRSQRLRIGDASIDLADVNSQGWQDFVYEHWDDDFDYFPVEYALNMQDARARNRPAPKTARRNKYLDKYNEKKSQNEAMASWLLEQQQREQQEKKLRNEAFISRVRELHQKKLRELHQKKQQENLLSGSPKQKNATPTFINSGNYSMRIMDNIRQLMRQEKRKK